MTEGILFNLWQQYTLSRPRGWWPQRQNSALISATSPTRARALELWGKESSVICEVGALALHFMPSPSLRLPDEPLRIVWSGQHFSGKSAEYFA